MLIFWLRLMEGKDRKLGGKKRKSVTEDFSWNPIIAALTINNAKDYRSYKCNLCSCVVFSYFKDIS